MTNVGMSPVAKAILTAVAAYALAIGITLVLGLAILILSDPKGCSGMERVFVTIVSTMAATFLFSWVAVLAAVFRLPMGLLGRLAVAGGYVVALAVTSVTAILFMMVAFNC
jgi:hypothetical protein